MEANRHDRESFSFHRQPKHLQEYLVSEEVQTEKRDYLKVNKVHQGDVRNLLPQIKPQSVSLSVWSPPYFVGKKYEAGLTFEGWKSLLSETIRLHRQVLKPGGFLVINIADILCFKDPSLPRIQAEAVNQRKVAVTKGEILEVLKSHPGANRHELARVLKCSEQTIDRRLHGNNIRGGKHAVQTRVKIVGGMVEEWAMAAGFAPYDRRIWVKDAAWENSRWFSLSYRSVDEFEYLYFFWKPGPVKVDRSRLGAEEWKQWGARGVWRFPSVRANDDHEAKFPLELPLRTIRLLTDPGELVLDCFMGSGTTGVAATKLKRNFIGIELLKKYVSLSENRIADFRRQGELFVP